MVLPNLSRSISSSLLKYFSNKNVFMHHKAKTHNKPTSIYNNPTPKTEYVPVKSSELWIAYLNVLNPFETRFVRIPYSNKFRFVLSERAEKVLRIWESDLVQFFSPLFSQSKLTERVAKKILDAMSEGLMLDEGYKINGKCRLVSKTNKHMKQRRFIWKPETKHLIGNEWQIHFTKSFRQIGGTCLGSLILVAETFSEDTPAYQKELMVASTLAHELGHSVAMHTSRDLMHYRYVIAVNIWCLFSIGVVNFIDLLPVTYLLVTLFLRYISRRYEAEADYISLMLMASAGYHPNCVLGYYSSAHRLLKDGLFCTHYSDEKRVRLLSRYKVWKEAMKIYEDVMARKGVKSFV